jgi:hypothetical protein
MEWAFMVDELTATQVDTAAPGAFVSEMTDVEKLRSLIQRIRPLQAAHPLVRIGGVYDGGYLVPDDLQGIAACFSPGVANNASFEMDMLSRGVHSHLADYSVDGPPAGLQPMSFEKKFLGSFNSEVFTTLDQWVADKAGTSDHEDYLLQMDIEGAEYETLLAASSSTLRRFRIIVLEVHDVESWGCPPFFRLVQASFEKLLQDFHVVHSHPNNWCGVVNLNGIVSPKVFELTFLRKDRGPCTAAASAIPHPLDSPNIEWWPDMVLPPQWR